MSFICSILLSIQLIGVPMVSDGIDNEGNKDATNVVCTEIVVDTSALKPHFNYYYELLIEKHRPELIEEWKQVERDKEAIIKKLKEHNKEQMKDVCESISEDWYKKHETAQERFLAAVQERNEDKIKTSLTHILSMKKQWNDEMKEAVKEF